MNKLLRHKRRARKIRGKINSLEVARFTVHRTPKHIYAQIFDVTGSSVIAAASSLEKTLREKDFGAGKGKIAQAVGALIAERAIAKGIKKVAFDRAGFKYHGRIKALADSARESGLEF